MYRQRFNVACVFFGGTESDYSLAGQLYAILPAQAAPAMMLQTGFRIVTYDRKFPWYSQMGDLKLIERLNTQT